eukprot:scaffold322376_cov41-Tisochrysis_lutea.AAC.1
MEQAVHSVPSATAPNAVSLAIQQEEGGGEVSQGIFHTPDVGCAGQTSLVRPLESRASVRQRHAHPHSKASANLFKKKTATRFGGVAE